MVTDEATQTTHAPIVVVVVTYNSEAVLPATLDALHTATATIDAAVVVVDNNSDDNSVNIARNHPAVTLVCPTGRNAGYAAGINNGMQRIRPTLALLALNADATLAPDAIHQMLNVLEAPASLPTGIVAPRIVTDKGDLKFSLRREPTLLRAFGEALLGGHRAARWPRLGEEVRDPREYGDRVSADWATGAALMVSAGCLKAVGRWDEDYFLYSEETDYALRARDAGYALRYAYRAVVSHPGGAMSRSPFLWSILAPNRVRLYRGRHGRLASACYKGVVILNELLRIGGATHRAALRALLAGSRPGPEITSGGIQPDRAAA